MTEDLTLAICVYNAAKYIQETLECIVKQTMQDFRLLIVNDCTPDNSIDIVHEFFKEHPRQYEVVDFEQNQGLAAGRRYVEENAKTKYILFVDADDCPYPTLVEKLYTKISSDEDLIAVGCHLGYIDERGKKLSGGIFLGETTKEGFYEKAAKGKLIFMQPTAIYDREAALSVGGHAIEGFPEGKPRYRDLCEDLDLWTRMSDLYTQGKAIVVIPEILGGYRKHENAMSTDSTGMILRMRHIKTNVKRRRAGQKDITFCEFMDSLSDNERNRIIREAQSANSLKKAYYAFKKMRVFSGIGLLARSIWYNPSYLWEKVKHNLLRMK